EAGRKPTATSTLTPRPRPPRSRAPSRWPPVNRSYGRHRRGGRGAQTPAPTRSHDRKDGDDRRVVRSAIALCIGHAFTISRSSISAAGWLRQQAVKAPEKVTLMADRKSTRLNSSHGSISYA